MISGAAFVPHPPVLVPDVAAGAGPELAALRAACGRAIADVFATAPDLVVLLGPAPHTVRYPRDSTGSLRPYGVAREFSLGAGGAAELPLSLTIGAYLLSGAKVYTEAFGVGLEPLEGGFGELVAQSRVGLLVLGDGSGRRSLTAPGYLDERAAGFDSVVATALATGDAAAVAELDADLGDELLASGTRTWRAAGTALHGGRFRPTAYYDDAPYGVGYVVASWVAR